MLLAGAHARHGVSVPARRPLAARVQRARHGVDRLDITGISNAAYGNFRFNQLLNPGYTPPFSPNSVGMDEDYDACDLENWFLAIQSADGQVMIPSFHRPAVVRYDPNRIRRSTIGHA